MNLVFGVHWGRADVDGIVRELRSPNFDPKAAAAADTLVYILPDADLSEITPSAATKIWRADKETFFDPYPDAGPVKLAFVSAAALDHIVMRMVVTLGQAADKQDEEAITFHDLKSSLEWLGIAEPDAAAERLHIWALERAGLVGSATPEQP